MKNKIKIAVVGIGLMGSQHLKALSVSKKAKLHSIVDVNKNASWGTIEIFWMGKGDISSKLWIHEPFCLWSAFVAWHGAVVADCTKSLK